MSAYADDPEHFWRWVQRARAGAPKKNPRKIYVPRRHLRAATSPSVLAGCVKPKAPTGGCTPCLRNASRFPPPRPASTVRLANGTSLIGHVAVLAVGHEEHPVVGKDIAIRPGSEADTADRSGRQGSDARHRPQHGRCLAITRSSAAIAARRSPLSRRGLISSIHRKGKPIRLDAADVPLGTDLSYFVRWFRDLVREDRA